VLRQQLLERLDVRAIRLERHADGRRAAAPDQRQRAVVRRRLGEHHVAGLQQRQRQELEQLERAVADQHLLGLDLLPLGEPAAQQRKAGRRGVHQHGFRVLGDRGGGGLGDLARGVALDRGHAAGEVDGLDGGHGVSRKVCSGERAGQLRD
jgi:hypothetical protein